MSKEKKLIVVEQVCEFAIGWTVGAAVMAVAQPKSALDKVLTSIGSTAIAYTVGRKFNKEFVEVCDQIFDVNLKDRFI
jgi:hypothetical protein